MACPASVRLSVGQASQDNVYTIEGTQAHFLLEMCQRLDLQPVDFIGDTLEVDGVTFQVSEELADTVQVFMVYIAQFDQSTSKIEHFMQSPDMEGLQGTADYLNWVGDDTLVVLDYKHGAGVTVDPVGNKQLLTYALLAMQLYGKRDRVIIGIAQPRAMDLDETELPGVRVWEATFDDVNRHAGDVRDAIHVARSKAPPINAGDHCRWCPAKASCPELHQLVLKQADDTYRLPSPIDLTPEHLAFLLKFKPIFQNWLDSVADHAKAEVERGVKIDGWKLVDAVANRSWATSHLDVARTLVDAGFVEEELYDLPKLKSPAQVEKATTPAGMKKKDAKALVTSLTQRFTIGVKLVPDTDKRAPTLEGKVSSAQEDFGDVKNEDS